MKLPSPVDLWSSLLRERLLLMNGAEVRDEVFRDEKLRLLPRRRDGLAGRDARLGPCWWPWRSRLPLFKLPPPLLPLAVASLPLLLRLLLLPELTLVLDVLLAACLAPGCVDAAGSFGREKVRFVRIKFCMFFSFEDAKCQTSHLLLLPIPT